MASLVPAADFVVEKDCQQLFERAGLLAFDDFMDYPGGERVCHKPGRSVWRFTLGGRAFYLKRNRFHWGEFFKRLSRGRLPPRSGRQEWENIITLTAAGIPTVKPVAFGEKLLLFIERASFSVSVELYAAEPLDEMIAREWNVSRSHLSRPRKRMIIRDLARFAAKFHRLGFNHQDFYLNHFFIDRQGQFYLLDLQRVQSRLKVPERYVVKDLAQLCYSSQRFTRISAMDKIFFLRHYFDVAKLDSDCKKLVGKINVKVARIARHDAKHRLKRIRRGELAAS